MRRRKIVLKDVKRDSEGRALIPLTVYDDSSFLSPYSSLEDYIITEEVAKFIEVSADPIDEKEKLHILITSDVVGPREQKKFCDAISNYYYSKVVESRRSVKRTILSSILMIISGVVIFILNHLLALLITLPIVYNVIDIAGWVFIWEAVIKLFIDQRERMHKEYRYLNLMKAKITVEKLTKETNKEE